MRDTPRAKPNEAMVSDRLVAVLAVAAAQLLAQLGGRQIGGVEDAVGGLRGAGGHAALAGDAVLGRAVVARAGGGGGSRRSGG